MTYHCVITLDNGGQFAETLDVSDMVVTFFPSQSNCGSVRQILINIDGQLCVLLHTVVSLVLFVFTTARCKDKHNMQNHCKMGQSVWIVHITTAHIGIKKRMPIDMRFLK